MEKESFIKILRYRAQVRWHRYFPESRPERLLHDKPWSEMSLWEKRMFGGKDGKPIPIKSFTGKDLPSNEECEKRLNKALKLTLLKRLQRFLDF